MGARAKRGTGQCAIRLVTRSCGNPKIDSDVEPPYGHGIEPPKVIVFAPPERVARLVSAQEEPVSLGGELLSAEYLVLVPFDAR